MEAKKFILDLIREGKHFYHEGNIFHAGKLFIVNSVIKWVVERAKSGEFDETQVKNYLNVVSTYLKGDVEIFWENGTLFVRQLKEANSNL